MNASSGFVNICWKHRDFHTLAFKKIIYFYLRLFWVCTFSLQEMLLSGLLGAKCQFVWNSCYMLFMWHGTLLVKPGVLRNMVSEMAFFVQWKGDKKVLHYTCLCSWPLPVEEVRSRAPGSTASVTSAHLHPAGQKFKGKEWFYLSGYLLISIVAFLKMSFGGWLLKESVPCMCGTLVTQWLKQTDIWGRT